MTPEILDDGIIDLLKSFRASLVVAVEPLDIEIDQIVWDRTSAIKEAVRHFFDRGRRNIAHLGLEKAGTDNGVLREQYKADAFLGSLKTCGVKYSQDNLILFDYNFSKIKISFPPLSEQRKISKLLSTLDHEIEKYQQKIEILEKQKKGLMKKLLLGELRV